jgi:hypothetical protein
MYRQHSQLLIAAVLVVAVIQVNFTISKPLICSAVLQGTPQTVSWPWRAKAAMLLPPRPGS